MQTHFSPDQYHQPTNQEADNILRSCVHCGLCTATCPTYQLLGDELDSPRGRIYLIKSMLENDQRPNEKVVNHIDRCLGCLACITTCPADVHYGHLLDIGRAHIENRHQRSLYERIMRSTLTTIMGNRYLFLRLMQLAKLWQYISHFLPPVGLLPKKLKQHYQSMMALLPDPLAKQQYFSGNHTPNNKPIARIILLEGCVQSSIAPQINRAAIDLLNHLDIEVIVAPSGLVGECCGALAYHIGKHQQALNKARKMIDLWHTIIQQQSIDAITTTTSGCGTMLKDYGYILRHDSNYQAKAEHIAKISLDISEVISKYAKLDTFVHSPKAYKHIAYHPPCSLTHGQNAATYPIKLLQQAGFDVMLANNIGGCCGSAGMYNILQPEIAKQLQQQKCMDIENALKQCANNHLEQSIIVSSNLGCMMQLKTGSHIPVKHLVEVLLETITLQKE